MPGFANKLAGAAAILVALWAVNALMSRAGLFGVGLGAYESEVLMLVGINVILAVSLNLINGFTGQFSIGHAGFMAIGAYSSAYFTVYHGQGMERALGGGTLGHVLAFTIAILIGALVAGLMGLLVGVPSLRLRGDYLAIVTLGFAEIIRIVILNLDVVGGATGFSVPGTVSFFWVGVLGVVTIVVVHNIVKSDTGRALISIREDELAAEAMGVNTTRYKVLAFVISSAMAGAGGVLLAHFDGYLNPKSFEFIRSFEILIMIILGGLGSIVGSILGAIVLTVLPEALRGFAEYRMVIYSLLLIVLMITRPQGLLGNTDPFKGWRARRANKTRTEAEEITAEDTRDANEELNKATLGERQRDTSLGKGDASK